MPKAKKSTGRPKKSKARSKPSARRPKPAGARKPRAAAAPQPKVVAGDTVEYACSSVTNTYPEAPAGLIEILDGISAINAGIARGRIVISVIPES